MAGYVRNDTTDNIATGNTIRAADLDGEYDAVEAAFNAVTGHTHDGTAAEGGPITVTGPAQDIVSTSSALRPKTDDTYDLGTAVYQWKDLYIDGTAYIDALETDSLTVLGGGIDNTPIGQSTPAAGTFTTLDATSVVFDGGSADNLVIGAATPANATFVDVQVDGNLIVDGGVDISPSAHVLPTTANVYDLGSATYGFRNLHIDGIAYIDRVETADAILTGGTGENMIFDSTNTYAGTLLNATVTSLTSPLAVQYGGTGAGNVSDARTNLGLGSLAIQDASGVNITGGSLSGVSVSGYATQTWVQTQGYITSSALAGYATQNYVTTRGYITSSALAGYATEAWVNSRGYITSSALNGYATEAWVNSRGYATSSSLGTMASQNSNNVSITGGSVSTTGDLRTSDGTLFADVSTGSVCINNTSWNPNYALNVYPSDSAGGISRLALWGDSGDGSQLYLLESTSSGSGVSGIYFGDNSDQQVGWLQYNQSTNRLGIGTNNSDRFVIDANGHVCISNGTFYEYNSALTVIEGSSGRSWTPNSATELLVERAGNCFISIVGNEGASTYSGINFGDTGSETTGRIWYEHDVDRFRFYAANDWVATLTSNNFNVNGKIEAQANMEIFGTSPTLWLNDSNGTRFAIYTNDNNLHFQNSDTGTILGYFDDDGDFRAARSIVSLSDERLKENIEIVPDALEKVESLDGVYFNFIDQEKKSIGLIAQNVQKELPELVSEDTDGMLSMCYDGLSGVLVEAIKALNNKVKNLEAQLAELQKT